MAVRAAGGRIHAACACVLAGEAGTSSESRGSCLSVRPSAEARDEREGEGACPWQAQINMLLVLTKRTRS